MELWLGGVDSTMIVKVNGDLTFFIILWFYIIPLYLIQFLWGYIPLETHRHVDKLADKQNKTLREQTCAQQHTSNSKLCKQWAPPLQWMTNIATGIPIQRLSPITQPNQYSVYALVAVFLSSFTHFWNQFEVSGKLQHSCPSSPHNFQTISWSYIYP